MQKKKKKKKNLQKTYSLIQIITFELVAVNCPYCYKKTRSWQLTC